MVPPRLFLVCTLAAAAALAGCQTLPPPPPGEAGATATVEEPEAWRSVATAADAALIEGLAGDWAAARDALRAARLARRAEAEGPLLDPAGGLPRAAPAPGPYACRLIRLGAAGQARPWRESGGFFCYVGVEGDRLSLTVEGGPERLGGYLWEEKSTARLVFLGAAAPPRRTLPAYGDDPAANAVGILERIGEFRYRLALPARGGSRLSVYELEAAPR